MKINNKVTMPLLFILVISSVLLIKIAFFRNEVLGEVSLLRILLLEFPIWMLFPAIMLWSRKKFSFIAVAIYNVAVSFLFLAVIWYERYFLTIPSYFDLKQSDQAGSVMETLALLYKPADFLFFSDVLVFAVLLIAARKVNLPSVDRKMYGALLAVLLFLTIGTSFVALQKNMTDVALFAKENGFVQTQLTQIYKANSVGFAEGNSLTAEELAGLKGNEFVEYANHDRFGIAEDRHLFLIQVESMQEFVINNKVDGQEITPNINRLLEDSLNFDNMFQQIGAGNTSDAEWLIHTSLYPKGREATVNYLNGEKMPSLVSMLNFDGYYTTTYHADKIEYWNRDKLYPTLGFDKYYSLKDMPNEDVIGIGPSDRVMFEFAEKEIEEQLQDGEKIYANLMTMTSHTPFIIPVEEKLLDLPERFGGTYTGDYLQSIRYTDEEIGKFIEFLKEQGIYEESLIVITGDHSGLHGRPMEADDVELVSEVVGNQYTIKDRFLLPFIITAPGLFENETVSHFGGQIDMMPTMSNLLGLVPNMPIIGHNLLEYDNNLLTMRYYLSGGSYMDGENVYLGANAKFPERYYDYSDMERIDIEKEKIEQNLDEIQQIIDYSDNLLKRYLSETEVE
ncbi:LTA synthase family protein [Planococcus sp. X10-3]|uniref:LTA synthase family protein n=1 Tax=Planococcus sp. X10-3 TaxID=3061240 RepID=UPI003BB0067D